MPLRERKSGIPHETPADHCECVLAGNESSIILMPAPVSMIILLAFLMRLTASSTVLYRRSFSRDCNLEPSQSATRCNITDETHSRDIATSKKNMRVL